MGNKSLLSSFCASLLLWTEIRSLHNVFSELCLQSPNGAGCIPLLSSSEMWPCRSSISALPTLASCMPWKLYLLCLLKKHIFTTVSTPEPIKLRRKELFPPLLHAPLPVEWPAKASMSRWPLSLYQAGLASYTESGSGPLPLSSIYCCFQQTLHWTRLMGIQISFPSDPEASGRAVTGSSSPVLLSAIPPRNSWATSDFCHFCFPRALAASPGAWCSPRRHLCRRSSQAPACPAQAMWEAACPSFLLPATGGSSIRALSASLGAWFWIRILNTHLAWSRQDTSFIGFIFRLWDW